MSTDRPDFTAIEGKLRQEVIDHYGKMHIIDQLGNLIASFGEQKTRFARYTPSIPIDDKGTAILAFKETSNSGDTEAEVCDMILRNPDGSRGTRWPIFEIRDSKFLNHKGEELRGDEIQEVLSILKFMREYFVRTMTAVAQA